MACRAASLTDGQQRVEAVISGSGIYVICMGKGIDTTGRPFRDTYSGSFLRQGGVGAGDRGHPYLS